jgi:hypothetical protein
LLHVLPVQSTLLDARFLNNVFERNIGLLPKNQASCNTVAGTFFPYTYQILVVSFLASYQLRQTSLFKYNIDLCAYVCI